MSASCPSKTKEEPVAIGSMTELRLNLDVKASIGILIDGAIFKLVDVLFETSNYERVRFCAVKGVKGAVCVC